MDFKSAGFRQYRNSLGIRQKAADEVCDRHQDDSDKSAARDAIKVADKRQIFTEASFRAWFIKQIAPFDLLAWAAEMLLLVLPTFAHDMAHIVGCATLEGAVGDVVAVCPDDCGPVFKIDAVALSTFPCEANNFVKMWFTLRKFPGNVVHAIVRRDYSVLLYMAALAAVAGVSLYEYDIFLRYRHGFILLICLAMAVGNTLAALVAPSACLVGTTAAYYIPPYVVALATTKTAILTTEASMNGGSDEWLSAVSGGGGGGGGGGDGAVFAPSMLVNVALKAVVWGRVLLSYQLVYGFVEWVNGIMVGYLVARRLYGSGVAVAALHPVLLLLQLLLYYAAPSAAIWVLERLQRKEYQKVLATRSQAFENTASTSPSTSCPSPPHRPGSILPRPIWQHKPASQSSSNISPDEKASSTSSKTETSAIKTMDITHTALPHVPSRHVAAAAGGPSCGHAASKLDPGSSHSLEVEEVPRVHGMLPRLLRGGTATTRQLVPYTPMMASRLVSFKVLEHGPSDTDSTAFKIVAQRLCNAYLAAAEAAATAVTEGRSGLIGFSPRPFASGMPPNTSTVVSSPTRHAFPYSYATRSATRRLFVPCVVVCGCVHLLGVVTSFIANLRDGDRIDAATSPARRRSSSSSTSPTSPLNVVHLEVSSWEDIETAQQKLQEALIGSGEKSRNDDDDSDPAAAGRGETTSAVQHAGGDAAAASAAAFTLSPVAVAAPGEEGMVEVHLRVWEAMDLSAGTVEDAAEAAVRPRQRYRIVVVSTSGSDVVLDDKVDVMPYTEATPSSFGVEAAGGSIRLRLSGLGEPGMSYIHVMPVVTPEVATSSATATTVASQLDHRPLATLPLLVLPSTAAAEEMCSLYEAMTADLLTTESTENAADVSASDVNMYEANVSVQAHVNAFNRYFVPFAGDVAYLLRWLVSRGAPQVTGAAAAADVVAGPPPDSELLDVARLALSVASFLEECNAVATLKGLHDMIVQSPLYAVLYGSETVLPYTASSAEAEAVDAS